MKKRARFIKLILTLCLILCLSPVLSAPKAYAVSASLYCTEGEYYRSPDIDSDGMIIDQRNPKGSVPGGMILHQYDTFFVLEGTATESGSFRYSVEFQYEDNTWDSLEIYITVAPGETNIPVETPAPEATPKPGVKITKHPTGEYVEEGSGAVFISRADNADDFVWRLVSPDTTVTVEAEDGPSYFAGLAVSGENTERLVLSNIPLAMDGWKAECKFFGQGGPVYSNGAVIHVSRKNLSTPKITGQPSGAELRPGGKTTLTVAASSPENADLKYQWYSGSSKSSSGGTEIKGATGSSFQPPEKEGTIYYYVVVRAEGGGKHSPAAVSNAVPVRYLPAPAPSPSVPPSPGPSASPSAATEPEISPGEPDYGGTAIDKEELEHDVEIEAEKNGPGIGGILVIVLGVILLAAVICLTVIYLKSSPGRRAAKEEPPEEEDGYNGLHDGIHDEEDYEKYMRGKDRKR